MSEKPANKNPDDSTNTEESTAGQYSPYDERTHRIIQTRLDTNAMYLEYITARQGLISNRIKLLNRDKEDIERELLSGNISKEKASTELESARVRRSELDKETLELMQLGTEVHRDFYSIQTSALERVEKRWRLEYDFHKHFTTLGTGSILFIAALSGIIFPDISTTEGLALLFTSLALLIASIIAAALAMKGSIYSVALAKSSPRTERIGDASWSFFTSGILGFVFYVGLNMAGVPVEREWSLPLILVGVPLLLSSIAFLVRKVRNIRSRRQQQTSKGQQEQG